MQIDTKLGYLRQHIALIAGHDDAPEADVRKALEAAAADIAAALKTLSADRLARSEALKARRTAKAKAVAAHLAALEGKSPVA